MTVLIRTIGKREYAYLVRRSGGRTVQTYLGPTARADVAAKVAALREEGSIPSQFHRFFWDTDPAAIDLHRHAAYVIGRLLEIGSLRAVWWLQLQYPTSTILQVLASSKGLSDRSRRFWSAWFEVSRAS
ncbi:hypothetical protein LLF88_04085 [bacterium]|nr:hypothetical protein [bacterium]